MKYVIVGVSDVDFTGRQGDVVKGTRLYLENENIEVFGLQTSDIFLKNPKDRKLTELLSKGDSLQKFVGMTINIDYDQKGKLVDYSFEV